MEEFEGKRRGMLITGGPVLVNDMQTPPPPPQKSLYFVFVPKDAQCSETYAKIFFRFFLIFSFNKIFILSFWEPDSEMLNSDNRNPVG